MIGPLIFVHRWLGVAFCLLFAMWFASGIVVHFVPYPSLTAADRRGGLAPIDLSRVKASPADALAASGIGNPARVRLIQRSDEPVYLISNSSRTIALHAADLSEAEGGIGKTGACDRVGLRDAFAIGCRRARRRHLARLRSIGRIQWLGAVSCGGCRCLHRSELRWERASAFCEPKCGARASPRLMPDFTPGIMGSDSAACCSC
jgi:hypothetical protein